MTTVFPETPSIAVTPTSKSKPTPADDFRHVMSIIMLPDSALQVLEKEAISNINVLLNFSFEELTKLQGKYPNDLLMGHVKSPSLFRKWCQTLVESDGYSAMSKVEWTNDFIYEIWDDFLIQEMYSDKKKLTFDEEIVEPTKSIIKPSANEQIMSNVRIDIRSYPTFDGKHGEWKAFKQKFEALATIHGFSKIMKKDYIPPVDEKDADYHSYTSRNAFLQSILEFSLASGTALSRVRRFSQSKNGREAWLTLKNWFEDMGSQETIAKKALEVITTHKLTSNSHGGAELFLEKFENALQDLESISRPYNVSMAKINFLNNILDDAYVVVKDTLEMDTSKTYYDVLVKKRCKSISVEAKKSRSERKLNKSKSNDNNNNSTNIKITRIR